MANPLKKTMVYFGLVDDDIEYKDEQATQAQQHVEPAPIRPAAPVAELRPRLTPVVRNEMNEILTVHPKAFSDAQTIAEHFRDGVPVIINLTQLSDADARRLIDFASGLSLGLYGKIERVTNKVFLLSPANIAVSGDPSEAKAAEPSFFG